MKFSTFAGTGLAATLTLSATALPAWALDGQDFADKLAAAFETNAMIVNFGSVEVSGDTVTVSDITAAPAGEDPLPFDGEIVFSGIVENSDGSYDVARAESSDILIEDEEFTLSVGSIAMENLRVSEDLSEDPIDMIMLYETFEMQNLSVSAEGQQVVSIESITASNIANGDQTEFTSTYSVTGIHAEPGSVEMEEVSGMAAALGLEVIDAHIEGAGTWNIDTGRMEITENAITIENAGKLGLTFTIDGYDLDLLTRTFELNRELSTGDLPPEEVEAKGMEMAMLMGQELSLVRASLRFEDNSITNKILDLVAGMNGAPREAMVAGFSAAVPAMAAEMGVSEELQAQLANAAAAFLANPQSLEITVEPAEPTPFLALSEHAEDPAALEEALNISVTANK